MYFRVVNQGIWSHSEFEDRYISPLIAFCFLTCNSWSISTSYFCLQESFYLFRGNSVNNEHKNRLFVHLFFIYFSERKTNLVCVTAKPDIFKTTHVVRSSCLHAWQLIIKSLYGFDCAFSLATTDQRFQIDHWTLLQFCFWECQCECKKSLGAQWSLKWTKFVQDLSILWIVISGSFGVS